jgi:ABC-type transport system involved in multi-copper enzyme maturation permease subunit
MFWSLFWKEYKENRWKLTFCGLVSIAFTAMLFRIRLFPDSANCVAISYVQLLAIPVIHALDIFSGEMSNRTIHLLFKIPVPRWKIFLSKYLVSILSMSAIFLTSGILMELFAQVREAQPGMLFKINTAYGISAILLFSWFTAFAAQSRSEAGSMSAMFAVMIGWAIILLWATAFDVFWAIRFIPYYALLYAYDASAYLITPLGAIISQSIATVAIVAIACYRFTKVRRYL